MKAMIVPGNNDASMDEIWYPYAKAELEKIGLRVIAKRMPDADLARMQYWLPFIEKEIGQGDDVILVGHSSGALAIMRYAQTHKVCGLVLVGACHTDGGDAKEKFSGYYDAPWEWDKIRKNTEWIVQFGSEDDPYIPLNEMRYVNDKLKTEYFEYSDRGHFMDPEFPELVEAIRKKL